MARSKPAEISLRSENGIPVFNLRRATRVEYWFPVFVHDPNLILPWFAAQRQINYKLRVPAVKRDVFAGCASGCSITSLLRPVSQVHDLLAQSGRDLCHSGSNRTLLFYPEVFPSPHPERRAQHHCGGDAGRVLTLRA